MTLPLTPEERDSIEDLAAECENPDRLRALLGELVRLRTLAVSCRRHHARLPGQVKHHLDTKVPRMNQQQEWARAVATAEPDPRTLGAPRLI